MMKQRWMKLMISVVVMIGCLAITSCSDDDSSSPTEASQSVVNVAGTWDIHATGYSIIETGLAHSGTAVTTTTELRAYWITEDGSRSYDDTAESLSGTTETAAGATGSRGITLNAVFINDIGSITMTGTVSEDNTSMSGNYVDAGGGLGTWTATRQ